MKKIVALFLILCSTQILFSQIKFNSIDLNDEDKLIFNVSHKAVTEESYNSLFLYDLKEKMQQSTSPMEPSNPRLITCYPQAMELLDGGNKLQIRNRYGDAIYNVKDRSLRWIRLPEEISKSDEKFIPVLHNRVEPLSVSPNGKWICYVKQKTPATGDLIIKDVDTGKQYLLVNDCDFSFDEIPAKWSPDSSVLAYEKNGSLYFINLSSSASITQIPENYRRIGEGKINSLYWASSKLLIYICGEIVYGIPTNELYTRALYSDLVGTGKIIGRLPYGFKNSSDYFWTSENGLALVLVQNNRTLWYMELDGKEYDLAKTLFSFPFVNIPGTAYDFEIFWTRKNEFEKEYPLLWLQLVKAGKIESYIYKLKFDEEKKSFGFNLVEMPLEIKNPKLSPNKKLVSFESENGIYIFDLSTMKQKYVLANTSIISSCWIDNKSMYLGEKDAIRRWKMDKGQLETIYLSSCDKFSWNPIGSKILASTNDGIYEFNEDNNSWRKTSGKKLSKNVTQNKEWRIFIGSSQDADYENALYARQLSAMSSNVPLFNTSNSGNKYYKPRVSIIFDAINNGDGLTAILNSLAKYNLKSTFFINGEFLRRFPNSVKEIVSQGHECASMFHTQFALNSNSFTVDETFVRRGLARNEDDFFNVTGKELSLIWHAPYYYTNETILSATEKAGYLYVDKSLAINDDTNFEDAVAGNSNYVSTKDIINSIIPNLKDGLVIPVNVGLNQGTREDYLYDKLDLLISGILSKGYDIVLVSDLQK